MFESIGSPEHSQVIVRSKHEWIALKIPQFELISNEIVFAFFEENVHVSLGFPIWLNFEMFQDPIDKVLGVGNLVRDTARVIVLPLIVPFREFLGQAEKIRVVEICSVGNGNLQRMGIFEEDPSWNEQSTGIPIKHIIVDDNRRVVHSVLGTREMLCNLIWI